MSGNGFEFFGLSGPHPPSWLPKPRAPFFIYNAAILRQNAADLRRMWPASHNRHTHLFYSVKANPNPHLVEEIAGFVDGFDVSSFVELEMLRRMRISEDRITASGPGKTDAFLELACSLPVRAVHLDSSEEYQALKKYLRPMSPQPRITLRLQLPGPQMRKLGIPTEEIRELLRTAPSRTFSGFHAYLGRELFSEERLSTTLATMYSLRDEFPMAFAAQFEIYLGPGIPAFTVAPQQLSMTSNSPVHIECGRSLIGTAGCYAAPVLSVKSFNTRRRIVIIDGGLQHLGSPLVSHLLGQKGVLCHALRERRESTAAGDELCPTVVHGSLCLWHDALHPSLMLPRDLKRGDWLAFAPCGSYGLTAAVSQFISQTPAREFFQDSSSTESLTSPREISPATFQSYALSFSDRGKHAK